MQRRCGGAEHKETSAKKKNKNRGKVDELGGFPARSLNELGAPSTLEWTELLLLLLLRIHVCRSEPRCSLSAGVSGWKSNPLADAGGGHRLSVSGPRRHIREPTISPAVFLPLFHSVRSGTGTSRQISTEPNSTDNNPPPHPATTLPLIGFYSSYVKFAPLDSKT